MLLQKPLPRTFVDSLPSPAPGNTKTNAFFGSPFSSRPPSPPPTPQNKGSRTADFFSSSSVTPLPPPPPLPAKRHSRGFLHLDLRRRPSHHDLVPSEPTPRPPSRSLNPPPSPPPDILDVQEDAEVISSEEPEVPIPGMIIKSVLSSSSSSNSRPSSSSSASPTSSTFAEIPVSLRLTKQLGVGTFSSVWLAYDLSPTPLLLKSKRSLRHLRRKESALSLTAGSGRLKSSPNSSRLMKILRDGVSGTRPSNSSSKYGDELPVSPFAFLPSKERTPSTQSIYLDAPSENIASPLGSVANNNSSLSRASSITWSDSGSDVAAVDLNRNKSAAKKRLVAVKMTLRGLIESTSAGGRSREEMRERDRTRVAFVREVEILKHISHPNITPLLSHLTTPTHHVLVLPYLPGGDLLGFVNGDAWASLDEGTLRRIFVELCKALGWMHSVGLVHRDVKLENILLTTPLDPTAPQPLIKLTDFGLSRFIDPDRPLLSTRCGSEAYAAPELVVSSGRRGVSSSSPPSPSPAEEEEGGYDARETDAWAAGVVLYALVGRKLPFGEGPGEAIVGIGRERGGVGVGVSAAERRTWLMRIARGEWEWPSSPPPTTTTEEDVLVGPRLVESRGAKRVVSRLLVRDPGRRARVGDLWEEEWMNLASSPVMGGGASPLPPSPPPVLDVDVREEDIFLRDGEDEEEEEEEEEEEVDEDGWLVDKEGIGSIARSEVH